MLAQWNFHSPRKIHPSPPKKYLHWFLIHKSFISRYPVITDTQLAILCWVFLFGPCMRLHLIIAARVCSVLLIILIINFWHSLEIFCHFFNLTQKLNKGQWNHLIILKSLFWKALFLKRFPSTLKHKASIFLQFEAHFCKALFSWWISVKCSKLAAVWSSKKRRVKKLWFGQPKNSGLYFVCLFLLYVWWRVFDVTFELSFETPGLLLFLLYKCISLTWIWKC